MKDFQDKKFRVKTTEDINQLLKKSIINSKDFSTKYRVRDEIPSGKILEMEVRSTDFLQMRD